MADTKPKNPPKNPPKNSSAPTKLPAKADESAAGAAQAASAATLPPPAAGSPVVATEVLPPVGDAGTDEDNLVVNAVMVCSQVDGFRRAGRAWSKAPVTVPIDELTLEQIEAIEREPMLQVVYVADETK